LPTYILVLNPPLREFSQMFCRLVLRIFGRRAGQKYDFCTAKCVPPFLETILKSRKSTIFFKHFIRKRFLCPFKVRLVIIAMIPRWLYVKYYILTRYSSVFNVLPVILGPQTCNEP